MRRKEKIILQKKSFLNLFGSEISFSMTLIPAGWYMRGNKSNDKSTKSNEQPSHKVQIKRPFWMMETQMTEGVYLHLHPQLKYRASLPNFPIRNVCWYDAIRCCNLLSDLCKLTKSYEMEDATFDAEGFETTKIHWTNNGGFRLPTETEWEWAARAISNTEYSGSTNLSDVGFYDENTQASVCEVAQKLSNNWGLYDMSGNVYEWCWDWFATYPNDTGEEGLIDPKGPSIGTEKVVRGGSWNSEASDCRVTARHHVYPTSEMDFVGFRCVLEAQGT